MGTSSLVQLESIFPGDTAGLGAIRGLFREYAEELGVDLCFQGFEEELANLPGKYAPPRGILLLASCGMEMLGCGAVRPLAPGICEMKRLYIRPDARGTGAGKQVALALIDEAARAGYQLMRLDTLARLESALGLYKSLGFYEIEPYYENPVEGVIYLERDLVSPH